VSGLEKSIFTGSGDCDGTGVGVEEFIDEILYEDTEIKWFVSAQVLQT
jgi:hypothetical protein